MEVRTTKRYLYLQGCIEMQKKPVLFWYYYSSKDYLKVKDLVIFAVAPHAGAWIEICSLCICQLQHIRRSPRGSVDCNIRCHVSYGITNAALHTET